MKFEYNFYNDCIRSETFRTFHLIAFLSCISWHGIFLLSLPHSFLLSFRFCLILIGRCHTPIKTINPKVAQRHSIQRDDYKSRRCRIKQESFILYHIMHPISQYYPCYYPASFFSKAEFISRLEAVQTIVDL